MTNATYGYLDILQRANPVLGAISTFVLYPGMEFGSREKWWPDRGIRPTPHEGIDFCYYTNSEGLENSVTSSFRVPVLSDGRILMICKDYLGYTVFLEHMCQDSLRFLSIYAHLIPNREISRGDRLHAGEVIGCVADTTGRRNRMPAHLHLSFIQVKTSIPAEQYDWDLICYSQRKQLVDPMIFLEDGIFKYKERNHWKEAFDV